MVVIWSSKGRSGASKLRRRSPGIERRVRALSPLFCSFISFALTQLFDLQDNAGRFVPQSLVFSEKRPQGLAAVGQISQVRLSHCITINKNCAELKNDSGSFSAAAHEATFVNCALHCVKVNSKNNATKTLVIVSALSLLSKYILK